MVLLTKTYLNCELVRYENTHSCLKLKKGPYTSKKKGKKSDAVTLHTLT